MKTIFENTSKSVKVGYDAKNCFVFIQLIGVIVHDDYIAGCEVMLEKLQDKQYDRIMFDNRELKAVSNQSRAWMVRSMLPRMHSPDLRISILNSKNFSSQLAVDTMREVGEQMGYKLHQVKAFGSMEEGINFLTS